LDELVSRLTNQGITIYLLDLTRTDIGVSVVRAVSPSLQPFTATVSAERFRQAGNQLAEGGKQGVPLM
jgi:ribosomal protein S12 methylthiotransferase accessory factor